MTPTIIHLGGEHQVTGSCHLLQANGLNIMVDCGLVQANDRLLPMNAWPVSPADIDYLFLTHAHIDHIGRVPELIGRGFKGEIITTHATKVLLAPMLKDAMGLIEWVTSIPEKPMHIKLVHGEPEAQHALVGRLTQMGYSVVSTLNPYGSHRKNGPGSATEKQTHAT